MMIDLRAPRTMLLIAIGLVAAVSFSSTFIANRILSLRQGHRGRALGQNPAGFYKTTQ
jgi:hypothetical protein